MGDLRLKRRTVDAVGFGDGDVDQTGRCQGVGERFAGEGASLPVEHHESEAGHNIDPISLRNAISWLAGMIPPAADR